MGNEGPATNQRGHVCIALESSRDSERRIRRSWVNNQIDVAADSIRDVGNQLDGGGLSACEARERLEFPLIELMIAVEELDRLAQTDTRE